MSDSLAPMLGVEVLQQLAADRNARLRETVAEVMERTGLTKLAEIAEALNPLGVKTARGSQSRRPKSTGS